MASAKQKARDRAVEIWQETKRTATAQEISDRLLDEGQGEIKPATIRVWKSRDRWDLCAATSAIVTPADAAAFEAVADALRALGVKTAKTTLAFMESVDVKAMTFAEAVKLSKIATDMISTAAMLDQKILSRLHQGREKELDAMVTKDEESKGKENPLAAAVSAFERAGRR